MTWEELHYVTGSLVDVTIILAAIAAVIKFRLLNTLGHRWQSELTYTHWEPENGSIIFAADYTLHNTGARVLHIRRVKLRLVASKLEGRLLVPDETKVLAERELLSTDPALHGNFQIESGERTIFTL